MSLVPTSTPLTHFKLLSFDVYGTLLDWEGGMYKAIMSTKPFANLPTDHPLSSRKTLIEEVENHERPILKAFPDTAYTTILEKSYKEVVSDYKLDDTGVEEAAKAFSSSVGTWPAFPDTLDALRRLKKHYYLVPLTNSDPAVFGASLKGPFAGFDFSAYYLASDIGSYKPDHRNFEYLFSHVKKDFDVEKDRILHVAQSLHHDHVPAKQLGLTSVYVDRQGDMGKDVDAQYAWKVNSLGELADLADKAFAEEKK